MSWCIRGDIEYIDGQRCILETHRRTAFNRGAVKVCPLQGRGNYFEVWGGGQTSPGVQGYPYPKLKTPRIWPTIFWYRGPSSHAKTNKNKNERLSQSKVGRPAPSQLQSCGGKVAPTAPPPRPPVPASLVRLFSLTDKMHMLLIMSELEAPHIETVYCPSWTNREHRGFHNGFHISLVMTACLE